MKSILEQLYDGEYNIAGRATSREYRKCAKALSPFLEEIDEKLGTERSNEFFHARADMETLQEKETFREGFLLGARLMLELVRETEPVSL